ncbi:GAF and ANTAR domain-containing protein [Williamsia soli]|uniref:GAF and ANTAR domain-containing protein n=1 Tax=Williamsia soli TaxID=364929 RepID=UPI001A9E54B8|nr:GAF and ANTAR domain-containing protein [Williamsia soli]
MSTRGGDDVYVKMAELVRDMSAKVPDDPTDVLQELLESAVAYIPGCDHASITTMVGRAEAATPVTTHEHARTIDALQVKHGEGPFLEAASEFEIVHIADLETEERWPAFTADVCDLTPVRSMAIFRLFIARGGLGTLNLYADKPHAFDQEARDLGYVYASHAAVVWGTAARGDQFRSALASRDIIGQAKGMLMERFDIGAVQAFELLRRLSQDSNERLVDIAAKLVQQDHPVGT